MAVFDVGQHVVNSAAGVISGSTAIDISSALTDPVSYTHLDVYKRQLLI